MAGPSRNSAFSASPNFYINVVFKGHFYIIAFWRLHSADRRRITRVHDRNKDTVVSEHSIGRVWSVERATVGFVSSMVLS